MKFLKITTIVICVFFLYFDDAFSEPDYDPYGSHYDYSSDSSDDMVVVEDYENDDLENPHASVEVDDTENSKKIDYEEVSTSPTELYDSRLPMKIPSPGENIIVVNPRIHAWGAYSSGGKLIRSGLASAGGRWCADVKRSCRTKVGVFRIHSLGTRDCVSTRYPLGKGGAPMPFCMYFNKNQGLHGSNEVVDGNISHGCVRIHVKDAEWLRYHFANIGTKVIILSY